MLRFSTNAFKLNSTTTKMGSLTPNMIYYYMSYIFIFTLVGPVSKILLNK